LSRWRDARCRRLNSATSVAANLGRIGGLKVIGRRWLVIQIEEFAQGAMRSVGS